MKNLKKDYIANNMSILRLVASIIFANTFYLIILYRLSYWAYQRHIPLIPRLAHMFSIILFSADISPTAEIGGGLRIAHSVGIVIGGNTIIGKNVQIYQNVTIGSSDNAKDERTMPTIGDNVTLFAGSAIIGVIQIGDNVTVGANAVVTKDFPNNVVVAGVPAQIIGKVEVAHSLRCI